MASRAWRAGRPCAEISDSDPDTGRLTGEAGVQYALRIRNACLVAAAFADAGITAIVTDSIINEGFESLTQVLGGRPVNFVVLRPPVAVLRQRGIDRLPEEAAYLADRYRDSEHPEAEGFAARVQAAADGQLVDGNVQRPRGSTARRHHGGRDALRAQAAERLRRANA